MTPLSPNEIAYYAKMCRARVVCLGPGLCVEPNHADAIRKVEKA